MVSVSAALEPKRRGKRTKRGKRADELQSGTDVKSDPDGIFDGGPEPLMLNTYTHWGTSTRHTCGSVRPVVRFHLSSLPQ